ncbi:MAG: pilin [Candidatus Peregrinibacteria bacterium]|nr:pilin [Candidatus Peregrinibacteria bacterium]
MAKEIPPVYYLNEGATTTDSAASVSTGAGNFYNDPVAHLEGFTVMDLIQMFVVYAFLIAALLTAVFIFIGGISFILSGGNDEKIKQAINTIRYSIVGLIVTILSFTFVTIVGRMFGLNFLDYISYEQIKISINRLVETGKQPVDSFNY